VEYVSLTTGQSLWIYWEGLTRLLLLVELSAWTSCLSNFTETGVEVGIKVEVGSSGRSSFTITSDVMTMSMERRGGSKTTPLDKG
jgi:hypothetical protein